MQLRVIFSLLIFLFCVFSSQLIFAQTESYLPFYTSDTNKIYSLAAKHRQSLNSAFKLPEGASKDYKKDFLSLTSGMSSNIFATIRHRALIDSLIDPFVKEIFQQVVRSNKMLPATDIIVLRSPVENAFAVGDGTVLINVGLISKLQNESQVAFVICHELAHIYFNHMQKGLQRHFGTYYNKEFQKDFKKIVKEEYNMNAKLSLLVQNASLNKLYHNRTFEQQADSLGYVLLLNAGYDVEQAYTCLQLLDKIERPYSEEEIDFNEHFGCNETRHLIKEKPEKSESIFAIEEAKPKEFELTDTLKTHPDCRKRMEYIKRLHNTSPSVEIISSSKSQSYFENIKRISRIEGIQSWYDGSRYDRVLFETLLLLQEDPKNTYLHSVGLLAIYQLKNHLKRHSYSDVVAISSVHHPQNFNQFLLRLHSFNLSDFEALAIGFGKHYPKNDKLDEYSLAAQYAFFSLINQTSLAGETKRKYQKAYPKGRLYQSLFTFNEL